MGFPDPPISPESEWNHEREQLIFRLYLITRIILHPGAPIQYRQKIINMAQKNLMYKVKANEFEFAFSKQEMEAADLVKTSPVEFNLIRENRSVNAKLVEADHTAKKLTIEIEGETFHMEIKDEMDQMLEKMGFGKAANKEIKEIKAPMPGLVLEITVSKGQEVKEGDILLILGAMKMEMSIIIHTHATIKHIKVSPGQAVDKGQVLVELE